MKVVITVGERDDLCTEDMSIDGERRLFVGPLCDCPEDATIERDLVSCGDVANYMQEAYEAGRRGETFEIVWKDLV